MAFEQTDLAGRLKQRSRLPVAQASEGKQDPDRLRFTSHGPNKQDLGKSWRPYLSWQQQDIKGAQDALFLYDPKEACLPVPCINILLCGGVGAGKSSIAATVDSMCRGRISRRIAHGQGTGSLTRDLRKYSFKRPGMDEQVQWQLWDIMGWSNDDYNQGELGFILDGNLPDGCELDRKISTRTPGFVSHPMLKDRVHCMLLVVPCQAASDEDYISRLKEMRDYARDRKIPWLILLSKIDTYDPDVIGADLTQTFQSTRLLDLVEELVQNSGSGGRKDIYPVKSLNNESGPTPEVSALMCDALMQAIYSAEDYLSDKASQQLRTIESDSSF